ncbi:MAG TPA: alpha/beta fold hydrolase [Oscillatoriaceae cyanobacterium M33_DOE_052]|uniref:Alpha/beta fold hydrolase n=1 Tax=Planktothricoides sp. SpSt-374 TaxID=2282167 RepID=A0A7C4A196_9CYAN|nr:alpha/beta fold hydrolase [Oscillatoriaceae cyanobacterium M33_DOE_052]
MLTPVTTQPEKPLFIFLPGLDGCGELLQWQITQGLATGFDIRTLTIPPDDLSTWDELTAKVVNLLEIELATNHRPLYLCGESFGGCLALKVALRAPELIDRLILVNPATCFNQRPWLQWGSHLTGWLPPPLYTISVIGFLPFLAALERMTRTQAANLLAAMQFPPQTTTSWRIALMREFEILPQQLYEFTKPVLLIASSNDLILASVAESERLLHYFPNAQRVILPHSGHTCLLETDINLSRILKSQKFWPQLEFAWRE